MKQHSIPAGISSRAEDYVRNRMDSESRRAFEAEMASDPALSAEVEYLQAVKDSLAGLDEKRRRMKAWDASAAISERPAAVAAAPRRNMRRIMTMAAAIAVLVIAGVTILMRPSAATSPSPYIPSINVVLHDSGYRGGNPDSETMQIAQLINEANYTEALTAIDGLCETDARTFSIPEGCSEDEAEYMNLLHSDYLATLAWLRINALAGEGRSEEAVKMLREFLAGKESPYTPDAAAMLREYEEHQ